MKGNLIELSCQEVESVNITIERESNEVYKSYHYELSDMKNIVFDFNKINKFEELINNGTEYFFIYVNGDQLSVSEVYYKKIKEMLDINNKFLYSLNSEQKGEENGK